MFSIRCCSVHKCALDSERMVKLLVKFCIETIKFNHYPERWLKVSDEITEKRKVPRTKKLRALKMTEAGMQLAMRSFLGERMRNKVEEGKKLSKHDCGSSRCCSIETKHLEKRLVLDHSKKNEDVSAREMSDLESFCDHQTPKSCVISEEAT